MDGIIIFLRDVYKVIQEIEKTYSLKGVRYQEYYLGENVKILGEEWTKDSLNTLSSETYVKNFIPKFMKLLKKDSLRSYGTPMSSTYHPEVDESAIIKDSDSISLYRSIIGSLNWVIVLGRFDILYATSIFSRYNMCPREGHFEAVIRILGYLHDNPKGRIMIDPTYPDYTGLVFKYHPHWKDIYEECEEELSEEIQSLHSMEIHCSYDSFH